MKRISWLSALSMLVLFAWPAHAGTGLRDDRDAALLLAAETHRSRQGTYSVGATGFCGEADNTWEWEIGSGVTCQNVTGISATGLLYAYDQLAEPDHLTGAVLAGDELVARYDATTDRPYAQDVELLVKLSMATGDVSYFDKAAAYYDRVIAQFTAEQNVDRHITAGRASLTGWDIASHIRAAVAVGQVQYAYDMAARLIAIRASWENQPCCGGIDATTLSYGSLLWALGELNDKDFGTFAEELATSLSGAQGPDGSWAGGDFQTTAYVLLGFGTLPRRPDVQLAVAGGAGYLVTTGASGGWSYPPEYGEINSEAMMALGAARLDNGNHTGFIDPQPASGNDEHYAFPMQ